MDYLESGPAFDFEIAVDLVTIAAAFTVAWLASHVNAKRVYFLLGYIALAGWLIQQFDSMENLLTVMLAVEATLLHVVARLWTDEPLSVAAHVSYVLMGGWMLNRLGLPRSGDNIMVNNLALSDLAVMATATAVGVWLRKNGARFVYFLAVHIAFLMWLLRELSSLTDGQGYVTIAWGIYAIALLIIGLRKNIHRLRLVALGTLFVLVAKLFLVDLARLETIWRVLLFFGFGGAFLALSYYFQSLWKAAPEETQRRD